MADDYWTSDVYCAKLRSELSDWHLDSLLAATKERDRKLKEAMTITSIASRWEL